MFDLKTNITDYKREKEREVVHTMIELYCSKYHGKKELCHTCKKLLDYSSLKIDNCPFMDEKTFCSKCSVHCYDEYMRDQIKKVMRFSGPRMIVYYPLMTIDHIFQSLRDKLTT